MPQSMLGTAISISLRFLDRAIPRLRRQLPRWQALEALAESDLRDLGLDRSELSSCTAEAAGSAKTTRRRIRVLDSP